MHSAGRPSLLHKPTVLLWPVLVDPVKFSQRRVLMTTTLGSIVLVGASFGAKRPAAVRARHSQSLRLRGVVSGFRLCPAICQITEISDLPPAEAGGFWTKLCGFAIQGPIGAASRVRLPAFPCRGDAPLRRELWVWVSVLRGRCPLLGGTHLRSRRSVRAKCLDHLAEDLLHFIE
jgi:hypothetical protein